MAQEEEEANMDNYGMPAEYRQKELDRLEKILLEQKRIDGQPHVLIIQIKLSHPEPKPEPKDLWKWFRP